jgi:hypothetical protein
MNKCVRLAGRESKVMSFQSILLRGKMFSERDKKERGGVKRGRRLSKRLSPILFVMCSLARRGGRAFTSEKISPLSERVRMEGGRWLMSVLHGPLNFKTCSLGGKRVI